MLRIISGVVSFLFLFQSVITVDLQLASLKGLNRFLAPPAELPVQPPKREIISAPVADLNFEATQIEDSKGRPTVQVTITYKGISVVGAVPAGTSTGDDEANTLPTEQAITALRDVIFSGIKEMDLDLSNHKDLIQIEEWLIANAGENFKTWGANATVPLSWALWEMAAKLNSLELDEYFAGFVPETAGAPGSVRFYMNIYNGGEHARQEGEELGKDRIDIQEIMIVPDDSFPYEEQLAIGDKVDQELKAILIEADAGEISRGNESGFTVKGIGDSDVAIGHVFEAIKRAGYTPGADVKLALDVAASEFYDRDAGVYNFRGEKLSSEQMVTYYADLVETYAGMFLSIEDGMDQNDWEGWKLFKEVMANQNVETIGDDLFVTQQGRLQKGIDENSASSILIKVNQNGSVLGTLKVIRQAIGANMSFVISHRSGETLHTGIADLAEATGALGLKTGDPQPPADTEYFGDPSQQVRRVKYERMVTIQERKAAKDARAKARLKKQLTLLGLDVEDTTLYHNAPIRQLFDIAELNGEGRRTATGAFLVNPTNKLDRGRRKKHRYVVQVKGSEADQNMGWHTEDKPSPNKPITPEHYKRIKAKVVKHLSDRGELFVGDYLSARHEGYQKRVRYIGEKAFQAVGVRHLFVRPEAENQVGDLGPADFTILTAPDYKIEREDRMPHQKDGEADYAMIIVDVENGLVIITGTNYIGENKKSIFALMNYVFGLTEGTVSTHSSAGQSETTGNVGVWKGLSGTGKSSLSAKDGVESFSDDETTIWIEPKTYKEIRSAMESGATLPDDLVQGVLSGELAGIFDIEGGLFPKTWELTPEKEGRLYRASRSYPAILQNVPTVREGDEEVLVDGRPIPDFMAHHLHGEDIVIANGRATFPRESMPDTPQDGLGGPPNVMFYLTQDRMGVLPPVSVIKSAEDAQFLNLLGYTATAAGTEQGAKPGATYSPLFGDPFFPGPFELYARKETEIIGALNYVRNQAGLKPIPFVLLNTGWSGGPEGTGKRMSINLTVRLRDAALNGDLDLSEENLVEHPIFKGLLVPKVVPGVTDSKEVASLDPVNSWPEDRRADYEPEATELFGTWGKQASQRGFWQLYPGSNGFASLDELDASRKSAASISI